MWYVVQTFGGEEDKTANMIRKIVSSECLRECFVPKRERLKKFHGEWNKVEETLFSGYVFVISEHPEEMYEELRQIPKLTKVLGREESLFFPLGEKEEKLVQEIGDKEHRTSLSKVLVRERKKIQVIDGPLKNYVEDVINVDLHKREVMVRVEFMGRMMKLKMGMDMVE